MKLFEIKLRKKKELELTIVFKDERSDDSFYCDYRNATEVRRQLKRGCDFVEVKTIDGYYLYQTSDIAEVYISPPFED